MAKVPTGWKKWPTSNIRDSKNKLKFQNLALHQNCYFIKYDKTGKKLDCPLGVDAAQVFLKSVTKLFFWKLLESFLPERKIDIQKAPRPQCGLHQFKVFCKTRFFWKFKTLKSRFIFCFSARLFFQSQSVTNPVNCHVANLRRAKPRFFNRQERETTDNAGWKRLDFFGSFHGFSFNSALIFAVFCYFSRLLFIIFQSNNSHSVQ